MQSSPLIASISASFILVACGSEQADDVVPPPPPPPVCEPSEMAAHVELGAYSAGGSMTWTPWDSRGTTFVPGVQGGFHVFIPLRYQGLCERVRLMLSLVGADGSVIVPPYDFMARSFSKVEGWSTLTYALTLCPGAMNLIDRQVHLAVQISDELGQSASAEGDSVLACPDGDVNCPKLCAGPS